jgi:hypothetical protein
MLFPDPFLSVSESGSGSTDHFVVTGICAVLENWSTQQEKGLKFKRQTLSVSKSFLQFQKLMVC